MGVLAHQILYFGQTAVNTSYLPSTAATSSEIQTILNIVFTITGSIALLVITGAGFRYIISRETLQLSPRPRMRFYTPLLVLLLLLQPIVSLTLWFFRHEQVRTSTDVASR